MRPKDLADRVLELREAKGWTQAELGEEVEYSTSAISKAERYREGDGMTSVRRKIVEALTGKEVRGPFYLEVTPE